MEEKIQIYELYGWWDSLSRPFFFIKLCGIGCCVILILYGFFRVVKMYQASRAKPQESWQEAIVLLQDLNPSLFEDSDMHRQFYSLLTEILKKYLSKRYQLDLISKTDQEILLSIKESPLPSDLHSQLEALIKGAEIIKFAHQESGIERMRYDLMRAIDIVRNTIPRK